MAGPNVTGKPDTKDYVLGRGIVYFQEAGSASWRDLGNAPAFSTTATSEELTHVASRSGLAVTDRKITKSREVGLSFQLDEFNHENLAMLFSGTKATHTNVSIAGFTIHTMVADGDLKLGRWYDIVNTAGERAYDVLAANLTVQTNEGTPVALVKDVDYELDVEMGRIFTIASSAKLITAIAATKGLRVTLTARAGAKTVSEVRGLTAASVSGRLRFILENPADNGRKTEYLFPKVTLSADGDTSLIGDDWSTMSFTGAAEKDENYDPDSPFVTIRTVG